jgi:hypothetical protein
MLVPVMSPQEGPKKPGFPPHDGGKYGPDATLPIFQTVSPGTLVNE